MNKKSLIIFGGIITLVILLGVGKIYSSGKKVSSVPTPTPAMVEQLPADKAPKPSLVFSSDGHYVTVNIDNLHAAELEYNLIYDATVKKNQVNTGVTGSAKLDGKSDYTYKQLLGSESSGKFSYHENIKNAVMELTLRDENKYSIFSATYPFTVTPGKSVDLAVSE